MGLEGRSLKWTFFQCLLLTLITPALFPSIQIQFFAAFLIILTYQKNYISTLWGAFFCGVILDLFSSQSRFGLYPLNFCLTIALLFPQRKNFFADSLSTLPMMTFFFSIISTFFHLILLSIFEKSIPWNLGWIFSDFMVMPIADATFAFVWFVLPYLFFGKPVRRGKEYFI